MGRSRLRCPRPPGKLRAADRGQGRTRLDGFDDQIISPHAHGLSVREIQAHLLELYGIEVSPDLTSRVTDAVLEEVREWRNRPLDPVYPVVFLDALRVTIRDAKRPKGAGPK
jgi:putative transposase